MHIRNTCALALAQLVGCGAGTPGINGTLPPSVIQQIVRQHYRVFRKCYEDGLRSNQNLQGRVAIRFVIERDGSVREASPAEVDPTFDDPRAVECIRSGFAAIQFPQPEGGIVTVVYPVMFAPGD